MSLSLTADFLLDLLFLFCFFRPTLSISLSQSIPPPRSLLIIVRDNDVSLGVGNGDGSFCNLDVGDIEMPADDVLLDADAVAIMQ